MSSSDSVIMKFAGNNRPKENIHQYPRPPALEKTPLRLQVVWVDSEAKETLLVDSTNAYRVLETTHPPTYYFPRAEAAGLVERMKKNSKASFCEWKGNASYYDFTPPSNADVVRGRVWSYERPTAGTKFAPIAGYLAMYAETGSRGAEGWVAYVNGEKVIAQEGNFYGSWKTQEHEGVMKGGAGTWGW